MAKKTNFLEFPCRDREVLAAMKRHPEFEPYFRYNVAIKIQLPDKYDRTLKPAILNWMPRHENVCWEELKDFFEKKPTHALIRDFCLINAYVLKNLGKQFCMVANKKQTDISYPNCPPKDDED